MRRSLLIAGWSLASILQIFGTGGPIATADETPADDAPAKAKGVVFHDRNENGTHDADEPGIEGIRVSNGADIVETDADGRYEISIDDDTIIFVIKPSGWATPLNELNLPQFYYIHKPAGSPADFRFAAVEPTGPLPESVDFPLTKQQEPDRFRALIFGDTQSRNVDEVEYMTHDVIEQVVARNAHDASFGVTLGDIVFDDLDVFEPHNRAIALIGIPWYNVIGNHDMNYDAEDDHHSDETFESIYGPSYYSFDYGPTHFMVLDDVTWVGAKDGQRGRYYGGLGERQMEFIRNDLEGVPEDQLVVLMMHIPLTDVEDRHELYRLIEQRPAAVSLSAHTHYVEHRLIGKEDDWRGKERHHHVVNVTVCGSWWRGQKDERGIPHATMSDGGPNGYSVMEFDGADYSLRLVPANRPADYQMLLHAPEKVAPTDVPTTVVMANVFAASELADVSMRVAPDGEWKPMERIRVPDPAFLATKAREEGLTDRQSLDLPGAKATPHMWRGMLPAGLRPGTHLIEVKSVDPYTGTHLGNRAIRVETE